MKSPITSLFWNGAPNHSGDSIVWLPINFTRTLWTPYLTVCLLTNIDIDNLHASENTTRLKILAHFWTHFENIWRIDLYSVCPKQWLLDAFVRFMSKGFIFISEISKSPYDAVQVVTLHLLKITWDSHWIQLLLLLSLHHWSVSVNSHPFTNGHAWTANPRSIEHC